jgi:hypothetical protein
MAAADSATVAAEGRARLRYAVDRAPVAQWIEHLTSDQTVGGSNPSGRARTTKALPHGR